MADRARADERNRIAGEMHDVIGHALTVSLLHVSSAQLALDDDPETARRALAEAERLARTSLDEVRAAVGVMRTALRATWRPCRRAADARLVESFRRAGTTIELDVRGDLHARRDKWAGGLPDRAGVADQCGTTRGRVEL